MTRRMLRVPAVTLLLAAALPACDGSSTPADGGVWRSDYVPE